MGHKVNPYGFRLGVIYPWKSKWYARKDYSVALHEDVLIRRYITTKLTRAGISKVNTVQQGAIGVEPFRYIMNDPRLAHLPKILETPKGEDMAEDKENMAVLRSLIRDI